jgi:hypothetical protein
LQAFAPRVRQHEILLPRCMLTLLYILNLLSLCKWHLLGKYSQIST